MSVVNYIKEHIPEPKQTKVLDRLAKWMGLEDAAGLTPELEQEPQFRTAIQGAVNLMRNRAFDWIERDDTPESIAERWRETFSNNNASNVAFGIRFSTTVPLVATFGFIQRSCCRRNDTSIIKWRRFHFLPNGRFRPQFSELTLDFVGVLLCGLSDLPSSSRLQTLRSLDLNCHDKIQKALDGYVRCTPNTINWEGPNREENERLGYSSYQ